MKGTNKTAVTIGGIAVLPLAKHHSIIINRHTLKHNQRKMTTPF